MGSVFSYNTITTPVTELIFTQYMSEKQWKKAQYVMVQLHEQNPTHTGYIHWLGDAYESGFGGGEKSYTNAIEFYTKGIELGSDRCVASLAWMYGTGSGVERDIGRGGKLHIAHLRKTQSPRAIYFYGRYLSRIDADRTRSTYHIQCAASRGYCDAMKQCAQRYDEGDGCPRDPLKAHTLYTQANLP